MNILPKKRWHVRTKDNIARVRRDEAEAAEKEKQEQLRIENADREARLNVLKEKSKHRLLDAGITNNTIAPPVTDTDIKKHINLFENLDQALKNSNKEHDKEVKEKKEEYEKQIGYLTYLGQDTNEALGKKNWYEVAPGSAKPNDIRATYDMLVLKDQDGKPKKKESDIKNGEVCWKTKQSLDPINAFKKYCHGKSETKLHIPKMDKSDKLIYSQHRIHKQKNNKDDKKEKLLKLREARLKREKEEKYKTEQFLTKLSGVPDTSSSSAKNSDAVKIKPKYNSQFNPELARQNFR